jgi:hypothetical protein
MNDTQTRLVHLEQALDGFAVELGQLLNYVGTRAGTLAERMDGFAVELGQLLNYVGARAGRRAPPVRRRLEAAKRLAAGPADRTLAERMDGFAVRLGHLLKYVGARAGTLAEQINRLEQRLNAHMAHVLVHLKIGGAPCQRDAARTQITGR